MSGCHVSWIAVPRIDPVRPRLGSQIIGNGILAEAGTRVLVTEVEIGAIGGQVEQNQPARQDGQRLWRGPPAAPRRQPEEAGQQQTGKRQHRHQRHGEAQDDGLVLILDQQQPQVGQG